MKKTTTASLAVKDFTDYQSLTSAAKGSKPQSTVDVKKVSTTVLKTKSKLSQFKKKTQPLQGSTTNTEAVEQIDRKSQEDRNESESQELSHRDSERKSPLEGLKRKHTVIKKHKKRAQVQEDEASMYGSIEKVDKSSKKRKDSGDSHKLDSERLDQQRNKKRISQKEQASVEQSNSELKELREMQSQIKDQIGQMQEFFVEKLKKMKMKNKKLLDQQLKQNDLNISIQQQQQQQSLAQNHNTRNGILKTPQGTYNSFKTPALNIQDLSTLNKDDQIKALTKMVVQLSNQVQDVRLHQTMTPKSQFLKSNRLLASEVMKSPQTNPHSINAQKYLQSRRHMPERYHSQQQIHTVNHTRGNSDFMDCLEQANANTSEIPNQNITSTHHYHAKKFSNSNVTLKDGEHEVFYQKLHDDLFAEKFYKVNFRDFQNNTRLNINNNDYAQNKQKRDRAMKYWKQNVIQNFLPPIDQRKRSELNDRILRLKKQIPPRSDMVKKYEICQKSIRNNSQGGEQSLNLEYYQEKQQIRSSPLTKQNTQKRKFERLQLDEFDKFQEDGETVPDTARSQNQNLNQ